MVNDYLLVSKEESEYPYAVEFGRGKLNDPARWKKNYWNVEIGKVEIGDSKFKKYTKVFWRRGLSARVGEFVAVKSSHILGKWCLWE